MSCQRSPKNVGSRDEICTSVVGGLGKVPLRVKGNYLKHLGVKYIIALIQELALLGSALILRKVL